MADNEKGQSEGTDHDIFVDPLGGLDNQDFSQVSVELTPIEANPEAESLDSAPPPAPVDLDSPAPAEAIAEVGEIIADAMPEAASLGSDIVPEVAEDPYSDARVRIFDITIQGLKDERRRKAVLDILQKYPISPAEADLDTRMADLGSHRCTRLSEFHAYAIALHLHKAAVEFQLKIPRPGIDDAENIPDLAADLEKNSNKIESMGAVAVLLPQKPGEILLSTLESVPGHSTVLSKGIVTAHGSIARIFFREAENQERLRSKIAAMQPIPVKNDSPRLPRAEIDKVFQNLLEKLQREAFRRGANGVVGVQISGFSEANSLDPEADQIRLIVSGTAVSLNPV